MVYEIPVTQARAEFADLINRVAYGGERVVVTRHGKPIVALVPAAELERLDRPADEAGEFVISTVSAVRPGSAVGERRRFGITAQVRDDRSSRHGSGPGAGGRRPGRKERS